MSALPLFRQYSENSPFALQKQKTITAAEYLQDVLALAALLPAQRYMINLCGDRYHFVVGLGAALLRQQISLLPPSDTPGLLNDLAGEYPDLYCLSDRNFQLPNLTIMSYPDRLTRSKTDFNVPSFESTQPAIILFTSGSTGKPQPQPRSWDALVRSTQAAGKRLHIESYPGATLLGTVPHQHSYGIESTVMLALQHGLILDADRLLLPGDICARLSEATQPRLLVTTPIHLRALLGDGETVLPKADLLLSATAPLSSDLAMQSESRFQAPLYEIYGCSEAGQVAMRRPAQTEEWQCFDNVYMRQDERGTWVKGECIDNETLLHDVIALHNTTHFVLQGRTADMVNIAGKRSSLAYLNHLLISIEGVEDGTFFMPEEDAPSVRLIAFVVAPGLSADQILAALRHHVDPAFLPRPLYLVDSLPRNELGKLPREAAMRLLAQAAE